MHHGRAGNVGQHDRAVDGCHLDVAFDALDEDLVAVDRAQFQIRSGRDLKLHIGSAASRRPLLMVITLFSSVTASPAG